MAQTVYDVGDLITSRLDLGVVPDGSTVATFTVQRPDGTLIAGLSATGWVGQQKTVQFWASDDGTSTGTHLHSSGDWLVVWTVTGTGASVSAKIYSVRLLPNPSDGRPTWTPFLSDVADYVAYLTVDRTTPGQQIFLGTFTGDTVPTDEQVQRIVDREVGIVEAATIGIVVMPTALYPLATAVVALRAAAIIARTYQRTDEIDLRFANTLDAWAKQALDDLIKAVAELGGGPGSGPAPVGYFPDPVSWGDDYL
jgi:hypothetical protein